MNTTEAAGQAPNPFDKVPGGTTGLISAKVGPSFAIKAGINGYELMGTREDFNALYAVLHETVQINSQLPDGVQATFPGGFEPVPGEVVAIREAT